MNALECTNVSRRFGRDALAVDALRDVTFSVAPGEFVAVMGPSGSGKSTLLNLVAGLDQPTTGRIRVAGEDLTTRSLAQLAELRRRSIGVVFQQGNLLPTLTAIENVMLPLELDGRRRRDARRTAREALEQVGIADGFDRYPDQLSGGQQQRIAIARGVVGERDLLLADEPTGALDTATGERVVDLLATRAEAGTAVMLVTHEPRFAAWADRVLWMRDGAIVDDVRALADVVVR